MVTHKERDVTLPLHGVRVLDLTDELGQSAGRFLADLGAEVILVESPHGSRSRRAEPRCADLGIGFALRNANKLGISLDIGDPIERRRLRELVMTTDIFIESGQPGRLAAAGLGPDELSEVNPALVYMSITGFGQYGPYREWASTESTLYALSGILSRSGEPGAPPLLPPGGIVEESVGVHAAWSALLAYYDRLHTGQGQYVDIAALEVLVHGFDPGFGVQGSAAAGRSEDYPRGRPDAANFYPVFRCLDGQVRICLLARRQWRAIFGWLNEPAEFADPSYDTIPARFAAADRLNPLIEELFSGYTREELVAEGAARGIPIGGVSTPAEVLRTDHFLQSGSFLDASIGSGITARIPHGYSRINSRRVGFRTAAPRLGQHNDAVAESAHSTHTPKPNGHPVGTPPFEGLRVLDLGVIVFGAELGRQFADNGADVIKIENSNFPDGLRQSKRGKSLAASVAWGHRNRRSLGLDLRTDAGIDVFKRLAAEADLVLANFKPGTLASMGIGYDVLAAINPGIIVSESSAFGETGPWNKRLGYGPLVRAACGVSALWRYSASSDSLCDGSTVYPDHIAAQVSATTVLAALIQRLSTGHGSRIEVAQADTAIMQIGTQLAAESLQPGRATVAPNPDPYSVPSGVFSCAGDDEWCVVSVRDDDDWRRLCEAVGRPDLSDDPAFATSSARSENRTAADNVLATWTATRRPDVVMTELAAVGVPAAAMRRLPELLTDQHLVARRAFTELTHPHLPMTLPTARQVAHFHTIPLWPLRPAPLAGEQTREVCRTVLGMTTAEIDSLVAGGVLQPLADSPTNDARD
ncbi:CaiB/BaiF CoA transferase family protein [Mycolicibacterium neoaurum]|uniref:CaiB/BaiF CoA transferase family protein n=1 Tax=Mycolicibacterium neoaurum TaxID=1795 RepID=UPI003B00D22C